jgi:hypothetical protein
MSGLLTGGTKVPAKKVLPGQPIPANCTPITSNMYILAVVVIGGLLLFMAFGHKSGE